MQAVYRILLDRADMQRFRQFSINREWQN